MHSRLLAFVLARLYLGLCVVCGLLASSDVLAGEGYIVIDQSMGQRPYLFFSDATGASEYPEAQGRIKLVRQSGGQLRIVPAAGRLTAKVPAYTMWEGAAHAQQSHDFSWLSCVQTMGFTGVHLWWGCFVVSGPGFHKNDPVTVDAWWSGVEETRVTFSQSASSHEMLTVNGSPTLSSPLQFTVYFLPASLGLTVDMLLDLPWGWWGNTGNFTWDSYYNILTLSTGLTDNPNFPPDVPINPTTGKPYADGVYTWIYDTASGKWVSYNAYTDATKIPSVALGPTGSWVYGVNPNGNVHNDNPEGSEWYWTGTYFGDLNTDTGGTDPEDPFTGETGTTTLGTDSALNLLSAIEQNTRNTRAECMGFSTAISGFRSAAHVDSEAIRSAIAANQIELMSCLNGHHKYVEDSLVTVTSELAASKAIQSQIVSELASGFGGVSGALSGIGSDVAQTAFSAAAVADNTAALMSKQDQIFSELSTGFDDVGGHLSTLETKVQTATEGLDRIEGKILDGNTLAQENLDMWASQILHWNDSDDQSLAKLQHLCDVADTLKSINEDIDTNSNHMKLFWELEKIRWVSRDQEQAASLDNLESGISQSNTELVSSNSKLSELIDEVTALPSNVPVVDLSAINSGVGSLVAGQAAIGDGLGRVQSELATLKYRLGNIDNALNTRMESAEVGELELNQVQEDVRDDLEQSVKDFEKKFADFEDSNSGKWAFASLGIGRTPNPVWLSGNTKWGFLEFDYTLDWTDSRFSFINMYRPLWILLERWSLWMACLFLCYKALVEV